LARLDFASFRRGFGGGTEGNRQGGNFNVVPRTESGGNGNTEAENQTHQYDRMPNGRTETGNRSRQSQPNEGDEARF
jgi:hypothetical protein